MNGRVATAGDDQETNQAASLNAAWFIAARLIESFYAKR